MDTMNYQQICKAQKEAGAWEMQELINSGMAWKLEGSIGRSAMDALESGACMLPLVLRMDYYGNKVPPRNVLKAGTKGTIQNSQRYWSGLQYEV